VAGVEVSVIGQYGHFGGVEAALLSRFEFSYKAAEPIELPVLGYAETSRLFDLHLLQMSAIEADIGRPWRRKQAQLVIAANAKVRRLHEAGEQLVPPASKKAGLLRWTHTKLEGFRASPDCYLKSSIPGFSQICIMWISILVFIDINVRFVAFLVQSVCDSSDLRSAICKQSWSTDKTSLALSMRKAATNRYPPFADQLLPLPLLRSARISEDVVSSSASRRQHPSLLRAATRGSVPASVESVWTILIKPLRTWTLKNVP
jgi:hypothetical protein